MRTIDLVTDSHAEIDIVRALFREYARSLDVDLSFQKFDEELASLPAPYEAIFIARLHDDVVGCVALRAIRVRARESRSAWACWRGRPARLRAPAPRYASRPGVGGWHVRRARLPWPPRLPLQSRRGGAPT